MAKFIEVHNHIINIESISKVEFISDDIFLGNFPLDHEGDPQVDFLPFTFATIETTSGEKLDLDIDLYFIEEDETKEEWYDRNRKALMLGWSNLVNSLGDITKATGYEYVLYREEK